MQGIEQHRGTSSQHSSRERARVVAVELREYERDFNNKALVWVEVCAKSTCGDCSISSSCGQGVLGRWFQRRPRCFPIACDRDQAALLHVGRWVEVESQDGVLLRASLLVFMLPLFCMLLGAIALNLLVEHDLSVVIGGALAFIVGFKLVRWLESGPWLGLQQPRLCDID